MIPIISILISISILHIGITIPLNNDRCCKERNALSGTKTTYICTRHQACSFVDKIVILVGNKWNKNMVDIEVHWIISSSVFDGYYENAVVDVQVPPSLTRHQCRSELNSCVVVNVTKGGSYAVDVIMAVSGPVQECSGNGYQSITLEPQMNEDACDFMATPPSSPNALVVDTTTVASVITMSTSSSTHTTTSFLPEPPPAAAVVNGVRVNTTPTTLANTFQETMPTFTAPSNSSDKNTPVAILASCLAVGIVITVLLVLYIFRSSWCPLLSSGWSRTSDSATETVTEASSKEQENVSKSNADSKRYRMANTLYPNRYAVYVSHPLHLGRTPPTMQRIIDALCANKIKYKSALVVQSECTTENNSDVEFLQRADSILLFCDAKKHFKQEWDKRLENGTELTSSENEIFWNEIKEIQRKLENGRLQDLVVIKEDGASADCIPQALQKIQTYNENNIGDIIFGITTGHSDEPIAV